MSKEAPAMPRKFAFDEFYEMLKEYVSDPKARHALMTYDSEYGAGRGYLTDGSQCSELAFDSYGDFKAAGWSILAKHGWPTLSQVIKSTEHDFELRSKIEDAGRTFVDLGRRLIRKEPYEKGWSFQDDDFDVDDRASALKLLKMWSIRYPNNVPYTLTGDE
ncbi:hypothetical protein [Hyphomicrobium sp.]|uniref:hypothetical protein n=1 Tax=Hyphomicrobium sp. TaxID=82 RepID=UPI002FE22491